MKLRETSSGREFEVELDANRAAIEARVDSAPVTMTYQPLADGALVLDLGAQRLRAFAVRAGESIMVSVGPRTFAFKLQEPGRRGARHSLATPLLTAPMPGKVLKIMVREGDLVEAGQPLITMEAMKMETTLAAEGPAQVKAIPVTEGQMVDAGAVLIELSPTKPSAPESGR
jgi:biotin carboxyl carrier protein